MLLFPHSRPHGGGTQRPSNALSRDAGFLSDDLRPLLLSSLVPMIASNPPLAGLGLATLCGESLQEIAGIASSSPLRRYHNVLASDCRVQLGRALTRSGCRICICVAAQLLAWRCGQTMYWNTPLTVAPF